MSTSTNFRTLGRLGTTTGRSRGAAFKQSPRDEGPQPARRRRRGPGFVVGGVPTAYLIGAGVAIVVLILWILGLLVGGQTNSMGAVARVEPSLDPDLEAVLRGESVAEVANETVSLVPGGGPAVTRAADAPAFAAIDDVALQLPLAGPGGVIFGEADAPSALALTPVGELTVNGNPEGFTAPDTFVGPQYAVGEPITGVRPATGLATILAAPRTALQSPVSGTVESIVAYFLDGEELVQISLRPEGRDDLFVVLRGLGGTDLSVGDSVQSGATTIGLVGTAVSVNGELNPLLLPGTTIQVQPAVRDSGAQVLTPGSASTITDDLTG